MELNKFKLTGNENIEARKEASSIISRLNHAPFMLSLTTIAETIEVSYSTICKVYEMIQTPRYDIIYKLRKLLDFVNYGSIETNI